MKYYIGDIVELCVAKEPKYGIVTAVSVLVNDTPVMHEAARKNYPREYKIEPIDGLPQAGQKGLYSEGQIARLVWDSGLRHMCAIKYEVDHKEQGYNG